MAIKHRSVETYDKQLAQNVRLWNQSLVAGVLVHTPCDQDVTNISKEIVLDDLVATPKTSAVLAVVSATPISRRLATTIKSMCEMQQTCMEDKGLPLSW
jgi:hypothetical protein